MEFYCDRGTCRKGFKSRGELKNHQQIHDNKLSFCFFCLYCTNEGHTMAIHINDHFQIRPYKCSFCEKSFFKTYDAKKHEGEG